VPPIRPAFIGQALHRSAVTRGCAREHAWLRLAVCGTHGQASIESSEKVGSALSEPSNAHHLTAGRADSRKVHRTDDAARAGPESTVTVSTAQRIALRRDDVIARLVRRARRNKGGEQRCSPFDARTQLGVGRSIESITRVVTGPRPGSSRNPSCSRTAVNKEMPSLTGASRPSASSGMP
jgi:hypothetical protein